MTFQMKMFVQSKIGTQEGKNHRTKNSEAVEYSCRHVAHLNGGMTILAAGSGLREGTGHGHSLDSVCWTWHRENIHSDQDRRRDDEYGDDGRNSWVTTCISKFGEGPRP